MRLKRSPWTLLVWPFSLLLLPVAVWMTGYLYWQVRISRAIDDLRREYSMLPHPNPDLFGIGSRGFSRMIRELDDALDRDDKNQATAFFCGLQDLYAGAQGDDTTFANPRPAPSMAQMRKECKSLQADWPQFRLLFAPWWMWWSGKRR